MADRLTEIEAGDWTREVTVTLAYPNEHPMNAYVRGLERRVRELETALREIEGVDQREWASGDGWRCVAFIQDKARVALAPAEEREPMCTCGWPTADCREGKEAVLECEEFLAAQAAAEERADGRAGR